MPIVMMAIYAMSSTALGKPFGYQTGQYYDQPLRSETDNDDSYAGGMHYDPQHNLVYFTGSTYGTFFDSTRDLESQTLTAMGMSAEAADAHLSSSGCFLGILKLPSDDGGSPELIYARRFGTPLNMEACSSIELLPGVNDSLLQNGAQFKLAMMGHVTPTPMTSAEVEQSERGQGGGRLRARGLQTSNRGALLHSIAKTHPVTREGRAYSFLLDFDVSLTVDEQFSIGDLPSDTTFSRAYGAFLGGYVFDSSPLVYSVAMTQNARDANQVYTVSFQSDDDFVNINPDFEKVVLQSKMLNANVENGAIERFDSTLGGAGGGGAELIGGAPVYGKNFYVKVQQLTVRSTAELMNVDPTYDEKIKQTFTEGWGFGFKLNDADDVRPSTIVYVKGRTPDSDFLLMGGTTRKNRELDAFVTKLVPPAPVPVVGQTSGSTVAEALQDERTHPTSRIESTTDRDETVTAICLAPPDAYGEATHAFIVGSTSTRTGPSVAYMLKMRLSDMSTEWKQQIPSYHIGAHGGDVLGEGCAVTTYGSMVYLAGTIDGGSALNIGGASKDITPVGGRTDVFVVAFDTEFGNVQWAKQFGSVHDDKLARGGGIKVDGDGNAIVLGSTRGMVQRSRGGSPRLPSDIFVMSLSRDDGSYLNAPFPQESAPQETQPQATAQDPQAQRYPSAEKPPASNKEESGGINWLPETEETQAEAERYFSPGAAAGLAIFSVMGVTTILAVTYFAVRYLKRRKMTHRHREGDIIRMWNNQGGDNFERRFLGGRRDSAGQENASSNGQNLAPVKSHSSNPKYLKDDWDDGTQLITSRNAWDSPGSPGGGTGSGLYSTKIGLTRKLSDENKDFLAGLRKEANAAMSRMVGGEEGADAVAEDPRIDGGASIKSLLMQYRETKKGTLVEGKPIPPPPPSRLRKSDSDSADGLAEFTII